MILVESFDNQNDETSPPQSPLPKINASSSLATPLPKSANDKTTTMHADQEKLEDFD